MLGGSVDFLADAELRRQGLDPFEDGEAYETAWPHTVEKIKALDEPTLLPTYYEVATAIAFIYFQERGVPIRQRRLVNDLGLDGRVGHEAASAALRLPDPSSTPGVPTPRRSAAWATRPPGCGPSWTSPTA